MIVNPKQAVMALHWICVIAFLGAVVSGDDSCPPPEELSPCTCNSRGLKCMGDLTLNEIKKAFQVEFEYGGVGSVWIQGTRITNLPANLFGNVKSQHFYVEVNNIITVDVRAFSASNKTLYTLSLSGNMIKDFDFGSLSMFENLGILDLGGNQIEIVPADAFKRRGLLEINLANNKIYHIGRNAFRALDTTLHTLNLAGNKIKVFDFDSLSMFENLGTLYLDRNQIEVIPDYAFNSRSLHTISLAYNKIRHIGSDAISNLPSLRKFDMALNQVLAIGPRSLASRSHAYDLEINLSNNQIFDVDPESFTGLDPMAIYFSRNQLKSLEKDAFAKLVTKVAEKGGFIEVSDNPFTCRGCDYSWLVANKDSLVSSLIGFSCTDGRTITKLTTSNIGCQ